MPALSKKKCFHCGKKLSARACLEHQKLYLAEIAAATTSAAATLPSLDSDLNVEFEFEYESDNNSDSNADEDVDTNNSLLPLPSLENDINDLLAADPATLLAAITALANVDGLSTGVGLSGMIQETNKVVEGSIPALLPDGMSIEHPSTPPLPLHCHWRKGYSTTPLVFEECLDFDFDFDLLSETGASDEDESMLATNLDCDPMFVEQDHPPTFDPINEPLLTDEEMLEILEMELGDLEDSNEWVDMYTRLISTRDRVILQFLATRLRTHFSRQTYDDLRLGACAELKIPSEFVAWRRLRILSDLESRAYDCCVNSCVCFLGKYRNLTLCPYCKEARFNSAGSPRRRFRYSPLIPQLRALFQDPEMAKKLKYRVLCNEIREQGVIQDVFDSEHYLTLRETLVDPEGEYHFFDNPQDIALGVATDGFTLFKRRRRGLSTAWPIIIINYNLNPRIRNRLENVLCVGVIPGPKQCKDLNSFLVPLLDELLELEAGVECPSPPGPDVMGSNFVFRAFLIILFGDIPAVAKFLMMKGHNAVKPCRACLIPGVLCQLPRNQVYYVPMAHPGQTHILTYADLPLRTHHQILDQLAQMEAAPTQTRRKQLAQEFGLNSRSIFAYLRSINLATCAPYDAMHLLFENLVPNLIKLWTGKFKGIDEGSGSYELDKSAWELVGKLTAAATRYIPSFFVGTLQNIALDGHLFKAEAYAFWFQYLAPILLDGQLKEPYFSHLKLMRDILALCLQFEITYQDIDLLQDMINAWVADYERLYYQYHKDRLPTCPLTIHALLHIPAYIRQTGPLWASWAFVMERFCGRLLPAVKNRTLPYQHLDNYVQRRAQMQIVSHLYQLPSLAKPRINYTRVGDENITSHEKVYPEFKDIVLGRPVKKIVNFGGDEHLPRQMTKYFATVYGSRLNGPILDRIDTDSVVRYGRMRLAGDGDRARTATLIDNDRTGTIRDNSYVKYDLLPDRNTRFRYRRDEPIRRTQYGRLLDIYYVEFVEQFGQKATTNQPAIPRKILPYLLARVEECQTDGRDAADPRVDKVEYKKKLTPDIIPAGAITAVIGRVELGKNHWAIVDRSSSGARVQFVDDEGNEEY
ncbi:Transposase family tnp2 [Rhizoctonia solani]|uniref:Transposase family tnp2 n=1 Tax=Rhizoctonia solani TaxID=456999 RepID=A0A8H7IA75_9AGAM|nr:Transposase family tnp2 [Rhizoctonia solani]